MNMRIVGIILFALVIAALWLDRPSNAYIESRSVGTSIGTNIGTSVLTSLELRKANYRFVATTTSSGGLPTRSRDTIAMQFDLGDDNNLGVDLQNGDRISFTISGTSMNTALQNRTIAFGDVTSTNPNDFLVMGNPNRAGNRLSTDRQAQLQSFKARAIYNNIRTRRKDGAFQRTGKLTVRLTQGEAGDIPAIPVERIGQENSRFNSRDQSVAHQIVVTIYRPSTDETFENTLNGNFQLRWNAKGKGNLLTGNGKLVRP